MHSLKNAIMPASNYTSCLHNLIAPKNFKPKIVANFQITNHQVQISTKTIRLQINFKLNHNYQELKPDFKKILLFKPLRISSNSKSNKSRQIQNKFQIENQS